MRTLIPTLMGLGLMLSLVVGNAFGSVQYTVIDLGTLGGTNSAAYSINASGQVVGNSYMDNGNTHAFLYSGGTMIDLGTLGGANSTASAINDIGQIVGSSDASNGITHSFRTAAYSPINPNTDDLHQIGDNTNSSASDINSSGQVVGGIGWYGSYITAPNGGLDTAEGLLAVPDYPNGINDSGHVVGIYEVALGQWRAAYLYTSSTEPIIDLGYLGGEYGWGDITTASDINSMGQIVGKSVAVGGVYHAYRTSPYAPINPATDDLGSLGGQSVAEAINNYGQVVGNSSITPESGYTHAFLYSGSNMVDLNTLIDQDSGWTLSSANGINDSGKIVGVGYHNDQERTFLLIPIPEPSTLGLLCAGIISLLACTSLRRKPTA
jgi:probable HAF family extracellular repeat protein